MLQKYSIVLVADNSGAKRVRIFQTYPGNKTCVGTGHAVKVTVRALHRRRTVGGRQVVRFSRGLAPGAKSRGLIVRTSHPVMYRDGTSIRFLSNELLLVTVLSGRTVFKGRRSYGVVTRALTHTKARARFRLCI